jgi:hypothetical protein
MPGRGKRFFSPQRLQIERGTHPASYSVGKRAFCPGVKRLVREADSSPPSTANNHMLLASHMNSGLARGQL